MSEEKQQELMADKTKQLKDKVEKKHPTFTDSLKGQPLSSLEGMMNLLSKHREDTEMAKKTDPDLVNAQETVKELSAPYSEALGILKDKLAYLRIVIKETEEALNG